MPRKKKYVTRADRIQAITNLDLGLKVKEIEKLAKADGFKQRFKYLRQKALSKKNIEYMIANGVDAKTAKKNARTSQKILTEIVENQVLKIEIFDVTEQNTMSDILDDFTLNLSGNSKHSRSYYYEQLRNISKTKGSSNVGIIIGRVYTGARKRKSESYIADRYNITKDLTTTLARLYTSATMIYEPAERLLLIHQWVIGFLNLKIGTETERQKHENLSREIIKNLSQYFF